MTKKKRLITRYDQLINNFPKDIKNGIVKDTFMSVLKVILAKNMTLIRLIAKNYLERNLENNQRIK